MNPDSTQLIQLQDELTLKVSSLLLEDLGGMRLVQVELGRFPLDDDLVAHDVHAAVRLIRLDTGILAQGTVTGDVELECARCLESYTQQFSAKFSEQFRETTDILDGRGGHTHEDEDVDEGELELAFEINDAHEIDMTELLRQWIVLALPMTPICGAECPGPQQIQNIGDDTGDARFAALKELLESGDE